MFFNFYATIDNSILLTIFIGILTFIIPLVWNIYQRILDIKQHNIGTKINNILTKKYYHKVIKYFDNFIQLPIAVFAFLGLFLIPLFFPFELGLFFLFLIFIYFALLPQIFKHIEEKSVTDLKKFFQEEIATSEDLLNAFKEIWQMK
ncbi:MAG: hypothetical protein NC917_06615, partial [Candidatus Omnitrophica bacterium]|nr:hypothetical protein [Candidatus Omnitrophota bacterium]